MPKNARRNILITGGAGFIGINFIQYWLKHHAEDNLVVLDALTYASQRHALRHLNSLSNYHFIQGNILDRVLVDAILQEQQINTIVHFAAESHVDRSILHPENFIQTNIVGTYTLLESAKKAWLPLKKENGNLYRFHHISTDEVYGSLSANDNPFVEMNRYNPSSPYSASKAAADHLVRAYYQTYGLPVTISQCSNNYGPFQDSEKFIPTVINACLKKQTIPLYGNGSNIRDWIYVQDHCEAIDLILQNGALGETYNVGADNEKSNIDVALQICAIMDRILPHTIPYQAFITFVKDRPGHDWRYAIDSSKLQTQFHYSPKIQFENGLLETIKYYQSALRKSEEENSDNHPVINDTVLVQDVRV